MRGDPLMERCEHDFRAPVPFHGIDADIAGNVGVFRQDRNAAGGAQRPVEVDQQP